VRGQGADRLLSHLGLSATGETESDPESPFSMARLQTGWRLIWSNHYACPVLTRASALLGPGDELLLCQVDEHVMASSAEFWPGGRRRWRVSHEGEDGPRGLEAEGELPDSFAAIRGEMENAQQAAGGDDADVDYLFEIPLKLAQALVGFKHDEDYEPVLDGSFLVLSERGRKKGFPKWVLG